MSGIIYLGLFAPFLGFFGLLVFSQYLNRRVTGIVGCTTILISFLCFLTYLLLHSNINLHSEEYTLYRWIPVSGIEADFTLHLDALSLLMTLIITGIGFLIHVYSLGYMDHEEAYVRYFACMNLFVFSMLLLVLAANLLLLFVGWEGVGLASYLLIGFWYTRPSAAQAATKAFVINRIGDLGLLLGILLTFTLFGTGDIQRISEQARASFSVGAPLMIILTLLYFIGAIGKSAQLPLFSWLPDAMEGPTPVSALIHAATMVTAGVYLIVRMHAVFMLAPLTLEIVGIVGGVTSLFAALCALGQTDLKRVLAYSTISQLGLMFLACGAGAFYSAMFHLTTHAFIKALLFLSAGNVVHMLHDTTEMGKMGGLSKIFSKTNWLFLLGVFSLAGIPPFAAFFSKDLILEQEHLAGDDFLFYLALGASILTGFYLMRAYCLTFRGETHLTDHQLATVKEAPKVMLIPVFILAFLSIAGGFLGFTFNTIPVLEEFLSEVGVTPVELRLRSGFVLTPETWLAMGGAFLGVGLAAWVYLFHAKRLRFPFFLFQQSFYVEKVYEMCIVEPLSNFAKFISDVLEPQFFEGLVRGVVKTVHGASSSIQRLQSGQIRSYIAWVVLGSVLLIVYMVF